MKFYSFPKRKDGRDLFTVANCANSTCISLAQILLYYRYIRSDIILLRAINVPPIYRANSSTRAQRAAKKKGERFLIYSGNNSSVADICSDPISKFSTRAISVAVAIMST